MKRLHSLKPEEVKELLPRALQLREEEGCRLAALHWLVRLESAREHWRLLATEGGVASPVNGTVAAPVATRETAAEVLHKSRVALRRLRAILREHRKELSDDVRRKERRALKQLGRATNEWRDADVQRTWLSAEKDALREDAQDEARRLLALLGDGQGTVLTDVEDAFATLLDPHIAKLHRRLSSFQRSERVGGEHSPPPVYADAVANRLRSGSRRIFREIDGIGAMSSAERSIDALSSLHRIRLRIKRQRALLALVARKGDALGALYELETRAQDTLGAMRDADTLRARAGEEGLHALAKVLSSASMANAETFLDQWIIRRKEVEQRFEDAIESLGAVSMRETVNGRTDSSAHSADAGVQGHQLPMEIERKFLLTTAPAAAIAVPPIVIEQGWIPGTVISERVRRSVHPDGRVQYTRTLKLGRMEARIEVEEDMDALLFQALWALTTQARIRKTRHVVREGDYSWEIDVFSDRELVLAEVEMDNENERPPIPAWLAPFVVREVTGDPAYLNSQLARPEPETPVSFETASTGST